MRIIGLIIIILAAFNCASSGQSSIRGNYMDKNLNHLEQIFDEISIRMGTSVWTEYEGGKGESKNKIIDDFNALISDAKKLINNSDQIENNDKVLKRRITVWNNIINGSIFDSEPEVVKLKADIEKKINDHKFLLEGKEYSRADLLKMYLNGDPQIRKQAFLLEGQLHDSVVSDTIKLIQLRSELAKVHGYRNYSEAVLKLNEIDPVWLDNLITSIDNLTLPLYKKLLDNAKVKAGLNLIYPWDLYYLDKKLIKSSNDDFAKEKALPVLKSLLTDFGINFDSLPIKIIERDFGYGGQTIAIRIPDEIKMAINPYPGARYWEILFHETGHALHGSFNKTGYPILKGYEWWLGGTNGGFSEGMAVILENYLNYPEILKKYAGLTDEQINLYLTQKYIKELFYIRKAISAVKFELNLYQTDSQNYDNDFRMLEKNMKIIEYPQDIPVNWAANSFLSAYPVYRQNYIIADIISSQVHNYIKSNFKNIVSPEVGEFLKKSFYYDGELIPWRDRIKNATQNDLTSEYYCNRFKNNLPLQ